MFTHQFVNLPSLTQENGKYQRQYVSEELGIRFPSITTVLSKTKDNTFLDEWKAKVGEAEAKRIVERATKRGTAMHALCEDLILNREIRESSDEIGAMLYTVCKPYLKQHVNNIRGSECALFSRDLGIAGTADLIADHDGVLSVIDYKSADKFKKLEWVEDYRMQGAFYAKAFHELAGELPRKVVIMVAVEAHTDWRGVEHDAQIQPLIRSGREIIEDLEMLRERKRKYDQMFPSYASPKKIL